MNRSATLIAPVGAAAGRLSVGGTCEHGRAVRHGARTDQEPGLIWEGGTLQAQTINIAEEQLGFALPKSVRRIYAEIGDEFGPGYGLLPLITLHRPKPDAIAGTTALPSSPHRLLEFAPANPLDVVSIYIRRRSFGWPELMLPFAHWGCGILSCLELSEIDRQEDPAVWRYEPNMPASATHHYLGSLSFRGKGMIPEQTRLSAWLEDWLEGKEMFDRPYNKDIEPPTPSSC